MSFISKRVQRHHFEGYDKVTRVGENGISKSEYVYIGDYYQLRSGKKVHLLHKLCYALLFLASIACQIISGIQRNIVNNAIYVTGFCAAGIISEIVLICFLYMYIAAPYKMEIHDYRGCHKKLAVISLIVSFVLGGAAMSMIICISANSFYTDYYDFLSAGLYFIAFACICTIHVWEKKTSYEIIASDYK